MTQAEFAVKIFMSASHLAGIEGASKELNERNIYLMCIRFGVNKKWLIEGKGEMFSTISPEILNLLG